MTKTKTWFVYILLCSDGSLYTGITLDVRKRFQEHKDGMGAKYTKARGAKKIVYTESCTSRSSATKREMEIKKLSREEKVRLLHKKII